MAEHLSDAWFDELAAAAAEASVDPTLSLVVQQVVVDGDREVAWTVRVQDGRIEVARGRVPDADLSLTQDRATAAAIARGELSAQAAFLAGRLRIGGAVHQLTGQAAALAALEDVFADVRARTAW